METSGSSLGVDVSRDYLGDIFDCHDLGGTGIANEVQWSEDRDALKYPPVTKTSLVQNISSAEVEKPCLGA